MEMKRLVDLVDRGPQDDYFFPASSNQTIFQRRWAPYHNAVPEVVEIGYLGNAAWGQRITIPLTRKDSGDMLQWLCLRLKPRSWLGADLEEKIRSGAWTYTDPASAWMWAASLGTVAIQRVEFQIGDALVESWGGEWLDVWSRIFLDAGRSAVWDSDIYGQVPVNELHDTTRPGWTTVQPTEDGYVYCWLPLTFLRRPQTAFPLVAAGESQEIRVHITLRPFADVVRRRAVPRTSPSETPLGAVIGVADVTGLTPIPYEIRLPTTVPTFEDATVFAGVAHLEDPLRSAYMRQALEMIYEPVTHMVFDIPDKVVLSAPHEPTDNTVKMQLRLSELNGPIREICWFIRRKAVWGYNEWTNYGALLEDALVASIPTNVAPGLQIPRQRPMLRSAQLMVGTAIWRSEAEEWWRVEYGLQNRGGVRVADGMVYGFAFGDAREWSSIDLQPAGTVNASRAELRLDLDIAVPTDARPGCAGLSAGEAEGRAWEVHVFAIGLNWMRFVGGLVGPLFKD
jgi:hypothetical protein